MLGSSSAKPTPDSGARPRAHLYLADLRHLSISDVALGRVLIPAERERAARFRRPEDRRRYLIGRSLVRVHLADALDVAPAAVSLCFGDQGKPFVRSGPAFNLSHSGNYVLLGIGNDGRFGLDIEQHSSRPDIDALMRRCFSDWEIERVARLNAAARRSAFFSIWARKEALLKALGGGLSIGLQRVSIDHIAVSGNVLRDLELSGEDVQGWSVQPLDVGSNAAAAVAWDRDGFEFEMSHVCDADLENVICALPT